jgi:hypothetical protein
MGEFKRKGRISAREKERVRSRISNRISIKGEEGEEYRELRVVRCY